MFSEVLNRLRGVLPKRLKQAVKIVLGLPPARIHPDWQILAELGPLDYEHIVLDLGARNGWFFSSWQKFSPLARIYAFEPDKTAFNFLQNKYSDDPMIHLCHKGIGADESLQRFYHLAGSQVSSSFLKPDQKTWNDIKYQTGKIEEREIAVTTLDKYCDEHQIGDIYLIKIDIQGYEMQALKGANKTLKSTSYLMIESAIVPLYHDSASFTEVHDYMVTQGFHMMDFRAWHRGNKRLIEADMLFRRNDLAPEIDSEQTFDRRYI